MAKKATEQAPDQVLKAPKNSRKGPSKAKGSKKASKKKGNASDSDLPVDNDHDGQPELEDKTDINLTPTMSAALLSAITDDTNIKQEVPESVFESDNENDGFLTQSSTIDMVEGKLDEILTQLAKHAGFAQHNVEHI
ncbi:hypothetical protein F4604DRAFT_1676845 [Suillus subluteus]|nr:hypothetical protein F4604DRAFT_1676845 [Suillus subluteus]